MKTDAQKKAKAKYAKGYLKRTYGITIKEYEQILLTQNGRCAICKVLPGRRRLGVDHNHATGEVRSLLCHSCNRALGFAKEDIDILGAMILYLKDNSYNGYSNK